MVVGLIAHEDGRSSAIKMLNTQLTKDAAIFANYLQLICAARTLILDCRPDENNDTPATLPATIDQEKTTTTQEEMTSSQAVTPSSESSNANNKHGEQQCSGCERVT